jgi:hypothetical protein
MVQAEVDRIWSVEAQSARMREVYPGFQLIHSTPWIVLWHGALKPYCREYEIQLLYSSISLPLANIEARTVHVEVLAPLLSRRSSDPRTPIPHLYPNLVMPERPRLCLHRPAEWTPTMVIADTIVPWTIEWLAAYEGWRATGHWYAGGHNTERERPRLRGRR